jgi:sodium/hydrogen exchanger 8
MMLGVAAGLCMQLYASVSGNDVSTLTGVSSVVRFNDDFFFLFLLPPIIFDSGFNMEHQQTKAFFRNLGPILWFALAGTLVSCVITALVVYGAGVVGAATFGDSERGFTILESSIFGSLLAATDPVQRPLFGPLPASLGPRRHPGIQ